MAATFPLDTSQPWTYNGVTYQYDAAADMWYAVSSAGSTQLADDLDDLEERVDQIEAGGGTGGPGLTYQVQTNIVTGTADPSLDLISSSDDFTNVKFEGTNGINISSSPSSIIIDGSDVQGDIDLDNFYTKDQVDDIELGLQNQIDQILVIKGEPSAYTLNEIGIQVGIRQGDFFIDNAIVKDIRFIALAPQDDNGKERPVGQVGDILEVVGTNNSTYRYEITTAGEGLAGVEFELGSDPDDLLIPGQTYSVFVYPQNAATATRDYVDEQLALCLPLSAGSNRKLTGDLHVKQSSINIDKEDGTRQWKIAPNTGDYFTNIYSFNNSGMRFRVSEGNTESPYKTFLSASYAENEVGDTTHPIRTEVNWLRTPIHPHHAANKQYVDDMGQIYYSDISPAGGDVNNGDLWVDSSNMRLLMRANGAWVNPDREADTLEYRSHKEPNGRKFKFSSGTGAVGQKFNYYDSGGIKLRLSNTDAFGVKWNDGGTQEDVTMDYGPYFAIWEVVDENNHKMIRSGRINRIDYHASDILCHVNSHRTNGSFSTSKEYWVSVGGIL